MTVIGETVMPDPAAGQIYDEKYSLYLSALKTLDGLWDEMQALIERS